MSIPDSPLSPTSQLIDIDIPKDMYAIVIIEFQGCCVKTVTLSEANGNLIEKFNSCFSGVTRTIVIGGSSITSKSYKLLLSGQNYNCGLPSVDEPITITLFNCAGSPDTATPEPSAKTCMYAVNGLDPAIPGSDSISVTIIIQNSPHVMQLQHEVQI